MRKAVIIHCWAGEPGFAWYPDTKQRLEAMDFEVKVPAMPDTASPKLSLWLPVLQQEASQPDKDLYLIGHSSGGVTVMRYLELLPEGMQIGGVVLVGSFPKSIGFKEIDNFFETPLDFEKIKPKAKYFTIIHSDNDPYVSMDLAAELQEKLGARMIVKQGMGHFAGKAENEPDVPLPDVAQAISEMLQMRAREEGY
jgi:predicted alpha/beta hydrolase family esterase